MILNSMKQWSPTCAGPFAFTLILTTLLGLTGCTDDGPKDDVLDVAFQSQISNLDRTFTTKREYIILSQLIDGFLFEVDPETLEYEPLLATSYDFLDDTTLDVTIRDGVTFHDGSPLRVADVLYTYDFILDPDNGARANRNISEWLKSVEQVGPMTVRFYLNYPYPLVLRDMAVTVPIRKEDSYTVDGELDKSALVTRENGLGPYKVTHFQPGREVELERYANYFKDSPKGQPDIRTIRIHTVSDWGSAQAGILAGELDWLYNVPGDIARNLDASGYATRLVGPSMRIGFLQLDAAGLTGEEEPLTDLRVRRAINHAIDRQSIIDNLVGEGASLIATGCNPVQFGCETDVQRYPYDPQEARQLLKEAGYSSGFPLTLWAYRNPYVAEAIAQDLRDIGINVDLRYVPLPVLNKSRSASEVPAYFGTWGAGGTADVAATLSVMWNLETDRNLARDPLVARLVADAERIRSKEERRELYSQALQRIADQAYWVPLYVFPQNYIVNQRLDFPVPRDGLPRLYLSRWLPDDDTASRKREN